MGKIGARFGYGLKLGACVPLAWLALATSPAQAQAVAPAGSASAFNELTKNYCIKCHNTEDWAGGVAMDTMDVGHASQDPKIWETAVTKLRGRLMPPAGQKQPSQTDVDAFVGFLETSLDSSNKEQIGHVPIQRLSRAEFAATVKALIGVDIDPKKALPTEVTIDGFTNIASALAVSPSFMEQYLSTVRKAVEMAVGQPVPKMAKTTIPVTPATSADFPLGTRGGTGRGGGGVVFNYVFPADGEYKFSVPAEDQLDMGLYPRGAENESTMVILVDGVEVVRKVLGGPAYLNVLDRDGPTGAKEALAMAASTAKVKAGTHRVVMTFIDRAKSLSNDATAGGGFGGGGGRISNMPVLNVSIVVEGPFSPTGLSMSPSRAKIFVCQPKNAADERPCAEKIARNLAAQAYRRPLNDADVKLLMPFYDNARTDGSFDAGVTELVTAILSSPDFLYRAIPASNKAEESRPLTDLELASRLSFLMWNTGPDQQLLDLAAQKRLSDTKVMDAQVTRMLKDPRANALVENFAMTWLSVDDLGQVEPTDGNTATNTALRANLDAEIRLFLSSVLLEDRSVVDLLTADWTFVNESLAQRYGIKGVRGSQFRRVTLTDPNRFGLLGKGAVLMATSYGDRTSPVRRGQWVLDKIVGAPPAPPPPNVATDLSVKEGEAPTTVRARLELHRTNPTCKACHGLIDPPGLALENFDNTGRWREVDAAAKAPIDAKTELTSGIVLTGPSDLRKYLTGHADQFPTTVTRRLMMYALNRQLEYYDMPEVRKIVGEAAKSNYQFSAIIDGIVNSDAFRRQGGEAGKPAAKPTVASNAGVPAIQHP